MSVVIIGLGRMGKNITLHLLEQGVNVVAYNRSRDDVDEVVKFGAVGAYTLGEITQKILENPIITILFVPSGNPVDEVLFGVRGRNDSLEKDNPRTIVQKGLVDILPVGSIIIDGGNSFYKDSQRRYQQVKVKGIHFLDMGTSGGLEGARNGACLMVGGDKEVFEQVRPVLEKIAMPEGVDYFGPSGAGHFVKMVHNAVEYGMMGAIAEGFNLVRSWQFTVNSSKFEVDLAKLAKVWAHGSIVSGLLMDKTASAFAKDPSLNSITGEVPRGETEGEMEWLETLGLSMPVIASARKERVETRTKPSFTGKVIAALRKEFGGHKVKES